MPTPSSVDPFESLDSDPHARAIGQDMDQRESLIEDLVHRRKSLNLTQTAVASRMGVRQSTISEFENEAGDPRLSTLQRYARAVDACVSLRLRFETEARSRRKRNKVWSQQAEEHSDGSSLLVSSRTADIIYLTCVQPTETDVDAGGDSGAAVAY